MGEGLRDGAELSHNGVLFPGEADEADQPHAGSSADLGHEHFFMNCIIVLL